MDEPRSSAGPDEPWEAWRRALPAGWFPWWPGTQAGSAAGSPSPSILPNWNFGTVFNVTEQNSAAPATEAAILQTYSYGRQLGQIADALQVLISERTGRPPNADLDKFTRMKQGIDVTKAGMAESRLRQFREDLSDLRERDETAFALLRAQVLRALDADDGATGSA